MADDIRNLADAVNRSASRDPGGRALVTPDTVLTWAELDARVNAVAAGLRALDLPPDAPAGEVRPARVALALPNVPEFAVAFFAVLRAGLIAVPVNPGYTARELRHQLADSAVAAIIGTASVLERVSTVRGGLPSLRHTYTAGPGGTRTADGARPLAELAGDGGPVRPVSGGEDVAVLIYTSGAAGAPRAAMLSHRALIANHEQLGQIRPPLIRASDVVLLALPMFHALGLNSGLGALAWHGATGVLVERFDPVETLDLVARYQISVMLAVPQMYVAWSRLPRLRRRLGSVRLAVSGAAPLDTGAVVGFTEALGRPVFQGYGLTETAPVVTTSLASPVYKAGSVGRPIPGVEIKLVAGDGAEIARIGPNGMITANEYEEFDDDAGGVPGTDPGEIVVRGRNLFGGYWPDGSAGPDADGWWATGDVAYADADGDLFIVDRLGELILVSGFNVYPREVELVLESHPEVAEAAVVGIDHPDTGQAVKAYVVRNRDSVVTEADLVAHCRRNLARFKCPAAIEFRPGLPHTATGTVVKAELEHGGS